MTGKVDAEYLREHYELGQRIAEYMNKRICMAETMTAISSGRMSQTKPAPTLETSRPLERGAVALADLDSKIENRLKEYSTQRAEIKAWLVDIDNDKVAQIIVQRFFYRKEWDAVAAAVDGGTGDSARKTYNRFMDRQRVSTV